MKTLKRFCLAISLMSLIAVLFTSSAFAQATVTTDRPDYTPGDIVIVMGTGWQPGETVSLVFVETPYIHPPETLYTVASASGEIYNAEYLIEDHDIGQNFTLTATGDSSGLTAQTTFTDAVGVSPATGGESISADQAANSPTPAWTSLGQIRISEPNNPSGRDDFSPGTGVTLVLKAPSGFEFNTGVTPSISWTASRNITTASVAVTNATTITMTLSVSGTDKADELVIGSTVGIQVRPTQGTPLANGQIFRPASGGGTAAIDGITASANADGSGGTNFGSLSQAAGARAKLAFVQQPTDAQAGATISPDVTVQLQDQFGNTVTDNNVSITMTLTSGTGILSGTTSKNTNNSGVATFNNLSINLVGSKNLTAASTGLTSAVSNVFTISPAAASQLAFVQQPTNATAGATISPAVTVQLRDPFGNDVASAGVSIGMALSSGTGTLSGTTPKFTNAAGLATFDDLSINLAGSKNLTASSTGLTSAVSSAFTISPAAASQLAFVQQPTNATAGATISSAVTVQLKDQFGSDVSTSGVAITVSLSSGTGTLSGTTTQNTNSSGLATFNNLSINLAGSKNLTAASTGLTSAVSNAFTISPAAASKLTIQTQPSATATAGVAFAQQPVIRVEDQFGNLWTGDNSTVVTATRNLGAPSLQGTVTRTASGGVVTFTNLSYNVAETINIDFTSGSLTGATSNNIVVSPAAASKLTIQTQPSATATAGVLFAQQPLIRVEDQFGNLRTGDNSTVVTAARNLGTGTLQGTLTATAFNGVASFADLSHNVANTINISFSSPGLTGATSQNIVVSPASAARLTIQTQPSATATAGVAFAQQPVIRIEDAFGNLISNDNSTVVTAARNLGSGTLQGTLTATAVNGVASFSNLSHNVANTINISFTSLGLSGATSNDIVINPATATRLAFATQPGSATAGAPFGQQPVVVTQDQFGNNSTVGLGPNRNVDISLTSGTGTLEGTTTLNIGTSAGNGTVTFTNLRIDVAGTDKRLTASTEAGFSDAVSDVFTVSPAAATRLVFTTQPGSATVGTPFAQQPVVETRDDFGNYSTVGLPTSLSMTITLSAGTGAVLGTLTQDIGTAAGAGVASPSNLQIDVAGTDKQLTATAASLTPAVSSVFTVNNPAPTLTSISPTSANRLQTLDVVFTGTNFLSGVTTLNVGSGITVNSITVTSATELTANITISGSAATGPRDFSVSNPAPGGGTSANQTFTVNNPVPSISSISPLTIEACGPAFDLTVDGENFVGESVVEIDGTERPPTILVSRNQLTVKIPASMRTPAGTRSIRVVTPGPGGGTSNEIILNVPDTTPPVITCPTPAAPYNADAGQCYASLSFTATATDKCAIAHVKYYIGSSEISFPYNFPVGTTTVKAVATDVNGLSSECTFSVVVVDNQAPSITCPVDIPQNTDPGKCYATVTLGTPTTSDNCGVADVTNDAPATFPVGTTTVTWTVTDIHGNSNTCTQKVTVADKEKPSITCPADIAQDTDPGKCYATVTLGTPVTSDNCGVSTVTSDAPATFPVGTTTVTWTVTDIHGNSNTCTQKVTVTDKEKPAITCPADIAQDTDPGKCYATVTLGTPVTSDNCGVSTVTSDAPATFPVGTTTVTWTVTDIHGNSNTCTQKVTVTDKEKPVITCPANIEKGNDTGKCGASIAVGTATATDNCGVASILGVRSDALALTDDYPVGTTTITWTATDIHGNSSQCPQTVKVNDTEKPVITCPANITVLTPGLGVPSFQSIPVNVSDNCGGPLAMSFTVTSTSSTLPTVSGPSSISLSSGGAGVFSGADTYTATFPVGVTIVTFTARDPYGNTVTSCPVKVTVPACATVVSVEGNFVTKASTTTAKKVPIQKANVIMLPKSKVQAKCQNLLDANCIWTPANLAAINSAGDPTVTTGSDGKVIAYSTVPDANGWAIYLDQTGAIPVGVSAGPITFGTLKIAVADGGCAPQKQFTVILVGEASATTAMTQRQQQIKGSILEITYPESVEWDGTQFVYPFIFWSDSDWEVDVCANVPEGYRIMGKPCMQFFVANETKVIFFDVEDIGSPEPKLGIRGRVKHNGKFTRFDTDVQGVRKGKKALGKALSDGLAGLTVESAFIPTEYALHQNFPDPFNPTTTLQFDLPEPASVSLKVYNMLGQEVAAIVDNVPYNPGRYQVTFCASHVSSGVYIYRMTAGSYINTKKMVLVK